MYSLISPMLTFFPNQFILYVFTACTKSIDKLFMNQIITFV